MQLQRDSLSDRWCRANKLGDTMASRRRPLINDETREDVRGLDQDDGEGRYNQDVDGWVKYSNAIYPEATSSPNSTIGSVLHHRKHIRDGSRGPEARSDA